MLALKAQLSVREINNKSRYETVSSISKSAVSISTVAISASTDSDLVDTQVKATMLAKKSITLNSQSMLCVFFT